MRAPSDAPASLRQRIREVARNRCGYCLSSQQYMMSKLEIEHIIPRAQGGSNDGSLTWKWSTFGPMGI